MGAFFTAILKKVADALGWVGDLAVAVFEAAWNMLTDVVCWVVDELLTMATTLVQGVDVSAFSGAASAFGSIPANVLEVLAALGMGTAFSIIVAAIGIRLVLQLIPFTRLGS